MSSIKCPSCGLVDFATALSCKRCRHSFEVSQPVEALESALVATDATASTLPSGGTDQVESPAALEFDGTVWREGDLLVMTAESVLPDRCVLCNAPTERHVERKVEWHPKYINYLAIFSWMIALVLIAFKKRTATIQIGICDKHFTHRVMAFVFGGGFMLQGLLIGVGAVINGEVLIVLCGAVAGLVSILIGGCLLVIFAGSVTAEKIEAPFVWLKGVHQDFLDSAPVA